MATLLPELVIDRPLLFVLVLAFLTSPVLAWWLAWLRRERLELDDMRDREGRLAMDLEESRANYEVVRRCAS
jgi:hypothetical protein